MRRSSLILLVLLLLARSASAAITFNADAQGSCGSCNGAASGSFAASKPTAGDVLVVAVSFFQTGSSSTVNPPTDNQTGNTYAQIGTTTVTVGSQARMALFYAKNVNVSGTFTVTETITGSPACSTDCEVSVIVLAFSGADTASPFDQTAANAPASSANPTTTATPTTAVANEVLVGAVTTDGPETLTAADTVSANGAQTNNSTLQDLLTEYRIVSATGAYAETWTATADTYAARIGTFKQGSAAVVLKTRLLLGVGI